MSTEPTEPNLSTVRQRRSAIAKQIKALQTEDGELEIAERVLTRLAPTTRSRDTNGGGLDFGNPDPPPVTQKDLVIATLRARAEPWIESSRALQAEIQETHGVHIRDSSLLPLLTTLKDDKIIKRDSDNRIALAERATIERRI